MAFWPITIWDDRKACHCNRFEAAMSALTDTAKQQHRLQVDSEGDTWVISRVHPKGKGGKEGIATRVGSFPGNRPPRRNATHFLGAEIPHQIQPYVPPSQRMQFQF